MLVNEKGYSLVELVITIVVFGIITASVTNLFLTINQSQVRSNYLGTAARAAQREVESLRNNNYNSLTPGSSIDFTNQLPAILPPDKVGTAEVSEPVSGLRRVDVTVTYTYQGKTQSVKLSSLIGVIGITQ
jgi:prepilin-type N-terminal cleavage/methylation domain-containing protein